MGNTPSAEEAPRRAPQKLSKPRTGKSASKAPAQFGDRPHPTHSASVPASAFASTSDFSETLRSPALNADDPNSPGLKALKDALLDHELDRRPVSAGSKRLSGLFRSKSSITNNEAKRLSGISASSQLMRAKSSAQAERASLLLRAETVPPMPKSPMRAPISSSQTNLSMTSGPRDISRPNAEQTTTVDPVEQAEQILNGLRPSPAKPDALERTDSDLSIYIPMRRRSAQQTPGLATRTEVLGRQLTPRSSFRRSQPPAPNDSRCNSLEVNIPRRLSMPAPGPASDYVMMQAHTPNDSDANSAYKQLGDISFGSLRITNGAPAHSPAHDMEQRSSWLSTDYLPITERRNIGRRNSSPFRIPHRTKESQEMPTEHVKLIQSTSTVSDAQQWPFTMGTAVIVKPAPDLETTSKQTEHDDCLFDDEDSPVETTVVRPSFSDVAKLKQPTDGLHRSDSGFASTASSQGVRTPLSKVDSGYSSSQSLHSVNQAGRTSPETEFTPPLPEVRSFDFQLGEQPAASATVKQVPSAPEDWSDYAANAKVSKDSPRPDPRRKSMPSRPAALLQFPLLSASKTSEKKSSVAHPRHARNGSSDGVSMPRLSMTHIDGDLEPPMPTKQSRFHRLIGNAGETRKKLVGRKDSRDFKSSQPVPSPVEPPPSPQQGRLHNSKSLSHIRSRASRDTLATILSVGSAELEAEEKKEPVVDVKVSEAPASPPAPRPSQRRRSIQAMMPSRKMSTRSPRRAPSKSDEGRDSDDDEVPDGFFDDTNRLANLNLIRHMTGNSAFDQAFVAMNRERQPIRKSDVPHTISAPDLVRRASSKRRQAQPPLRTRSSAPDFHHITLQPLSPVLSPGMSERDVKGPPPPISMRMHSVKSMRKQARRSRRASIAAEELKYMPSLNLAHSGGPRPTHEPAMSMDYASHGDPNRNAGVKPPRYNAPAVSGGRPPPPSRSYGGDGWRQHDSFQPHHQMPSSPARSRPTGQRPWISQDSYQQHRAPRVTNGPASPNRGQEGSRHRVLHSHNSHAYRNAPVWG